MGLYDGYRLSNSTGIPQYVGSALPEVTKLFDVNQQTYDAAFQTKLGTADAIQNAPVLAQDRSTWQGMNDEFQQTMKADIEAGDFENMYGRIAQQARTTVNRLKPLAQQVQAQQEYYKSLDDKSLNLTERHKAVLKNMAEDRYHGVQFDASGRIVPGTQYQGAPATKVIDVNEKIRNALSIMHPNAGKNIVKSDDGMWKMERGNGWETISKADVEKVYQAGMANDPEWRAHNEQEVTLNTYVRTRGLTDDLVVKAAQQNPQLGAAIQLEMANGYSPAQAYAKLVQQEEYTNVNKTQKEYAFGKAYSQTESSRADGVGEGWGIMFRHNLEKGDVVEGITLPTANEPVNPNEKLADLQAKTKELGDKVYIAKQGVNQWVKLDQFGQPQIDQKTGAYIRNPATADQPIPIEVSNKLKFLDSQVGAWKEKQRQEKAVLDEAAAKAGYKGGFESVGKEYDNMFDKLGGGAAKTAPVFDPKTKDWSAQKPATVSKEDLMHSITSKGAGYEEYKNGETTFHITKKDGTNVIIGGATAQMYKNALTKYTQAPTNKEAAQERIKADAAKNYQTYVKNYSVVNPAVSLDNSTPELKAFAKNNVDVIANNRAELDFTDTHGTPIDKKDVMKMPMDKAELGATSKLGNSVVQTIRIPATSTTEEMNIKVTFPVGSNIGRRYFELTKGSKDPGVQEFSQLLNPASQNQEIAALTPKGRVEIKGRGSNLFVERVNDGPKPSFGIYYLDAKGEKVWMLNDKKVTYYTENPIRAELEALKHYEP